MPPFDVDSVRARLPGRRIDWFESLDSTMIEARRDLQPGRIVGAEEQTAGMGRHGRKWISEAGAGLYVSMVLAAKPRSGHHARAGSCDTRRDRARRRSYAGPTMC